MEMEDEMSVSDNMRSALLGVLPKRPSLFEIGKVSVNASVSKETTAIDEVLRYYVEVGTNVRVSKDDGRPETWHREAAARQIHGHLYGRIENALHRIHDRARMGADVSQDISDLIELVAAS